MKRYECDCVDCGLPCLLAGCPYYCVLHCYCDKCGYEDELYEFGDKELCEECLMKEISVIDDDDCCDECGNEDIDLYEYGGRHLCENCLLEEIPHVSEE